VVINLSMYNTRVRINRLLTGFTLIEIVIGIGIIFLVGFSVTSIFSSFRETSQINSDTDVIVVVVHDARARTLESEGPAQFGVHFEDDRIILYKGAVYSASDPNNETTLLHARIELSDISLQGGGQDALFGFLTGETNEFGTLILRSRKNTALTRTITILESGLVFVEYATTSSSPPPTGLEGHWTFDEGAGTSAGDSSGNGNTGTLVNGPTWDTGKIGGGLRFDGSNDYVDVSSTMNPYTYQEFSILRGTNQIKQRWMMKNQFGNTGIVMMKLHSLQQMIAATRIDFALILR